MLRLENPDNVCYANAGTNALLSSPCGTRFLFSLPINNAKLQEISFVTYEKLHGLVICKYEG